MREPGGRSIAGRHHHVVDHSRQATEELIERVEVRGVEHRTAQRVELARSAFETIWISAGNDQVGSFGTPSAARLESDAGAAADHNNSLADEFLGKCKKFRNPTRPPFGPTQFMDHTASLQRAE